MRIEEIIVLLIIFVASALAGKCADKDPMACKSLLAKKGDMCSDPCLSDICRYTCNFCPLTCYSCKDELYPEECNKTLQCSSVHEYCIAIQKLSDDFIPLFESGCADTRRCLNIFGEINTKREISKRDYTLKGGCCDRNRCNFHDPELAPADPNPTIPTRPVYNANSGHFTKCEESDVDSSFCAALQAADPSICQTDCVAYKMCPVTCKTCRKCYDCKSVANKEDCLSVTTCLPGQKCVSVKQLAADFSETERLGCMNKTLCDRYFGNSGPGLLGKRQLASGSCCDTDLCQHAAPTTTPAPTTPAPTTTTAPTTSAPTITPTQRTALASTTTTSTTTTTPTTTPTTTTTTTTTLMPTTRIPCDDYDDQGYCAKYVPTICTHADSLSEKFAVANCARSCNFCDLFDKMLDAGTIAINGFVG